MVFGGNGGEFEWKAAKRKRLKKSREKKKENESEMKQGPRGSKRCDFIVTYCSMVDYVI